jgi:hypothetical protein
MEGCFLLQAHVEGSFRAQRESQDANDEGEQEKSYPFTLGEMKGRGSFTSVDARVTQSRDDSKTMHVLSSWFAMRSAATSASFEQRCLATMGRIV